MGMLEYLEDIIGSNKYVGAIEEANAQVEETQQERMLHFKKVSASEKSRDDLEGAKAEAEEEEIQEALKNIAKTHQTSEPIKGKRKSVKGDIVVVDFVGSVNGEEFPGGKAEDYQLELGSGNFIPGPQNQEDQRKLGG